VESQLLLVFLRNHFSIDTVLLLFQLPLLFPLIVLVVIKALTSKGNGDCHQSKIRLVCESCSLGSSGFSILGHLQCAALLAYVVSLFWVAAQQESALAMAMLVNFGLAMIVLPMVGVLWGLRFFFVLSRRDIYCAGWQLVELAILVFCWFVSRDGLCCWRLLAAALLSVCAITWFSPAARILFRRRLCSIS